MCDFVRQKLHYLIEHKSLIDLRKYRKNSYGLYWSALIGESTLGIGDTLAILQAAGKISFEIKLLIICVSGETT